jgi:hypothetical protein
MKMKSLTNKRLADYTVKTARGDILEKGSAWLAFRAGNGDVNVRAHARLTRTLLDTYPEAARVEVTNRD